MSFKILALGAALAFAASTAMAAPFTASLEQAAPKQGDQVIDGAQWTCAGNSCQVTSDTEHLGYKDACRSIAKAQGALTSFTDDHGNAVDAATLAKCNSAAKKAR